MSRISISFALAIALLPVTLFASDWPRFRGPNADGISPEVGINKSWNENPPKLLWKTEMSDNGYACPSAAGGKVFIIDHKGARDIVRAIDINTGKDVWKYSYEDSEKENYGFSRATPAVSSGRVYALSRLGLLNCLDAKTGKKLWSRNICAEFKAKKPVHSYSLSPIVDGNRVIVCSGGPDASMVALDKTTGRTIWQGGGREQAAYSTPQRVTINGKPQYVTMDYKGAIGVDANTGALLWRYEWKTQDGLNIATPIVIRNSVFITAGYGHGCTLLEVTSDGVKPRYESKDLQAHFSSPVLVDSYIYSDSDPGDLVCMDPQTGSVKWKQPGFEKGPVVGIDGVLIAAEGATGNLVMVKPGPEKYEELGRFKPLGSQIWVAPIISNGKMIVRDKTTLACFSLK